MSNPFSGIITTEYKALYKNMIDALLESDGLTRLCKIEYGVTKYTDCTNCSGTSIGNKTSTNKYLTGGTAKFNDICSSCGGQRKIPYEPTENIYLAVIFDYKDWIRLGAANQLINRASKTGKTPESYAQTISKITTLPKLTQAKTIILDTVIEPYVINRFQRYGSPEPAGFGADDYIITMWERVG